MSLGAFLLSLSYLLLFSTILLFSCCRSTDWFGMGFASNVVRDSFMMVSTSARPCFLRSRFVAMIDIPSVNRFYGIGNE